MHSLIIISCLVVALILLAILAVIDLRSMLLPDKFVLPFLVTGIVFHIAMSFLFAGPLDMVEGAALGGGLLYAVRFFANRHYQQDALGLGDVKLMAAAGVWLGPVYILTALTAGALAGIVHGLGLALYRYTRTGKAENLSRLSLPAGPGFIAGIILAGFLAFKDLPHVISVNPFAS